MSGQNRLGHLLLRSQVVTKEQLDTALEIARTEQERLETILLRLGYVTEHDIYRALAEQFQLPLVKVDDLDVQADVARQVGEYFARQHRVLPIREEHDHIVVAASDPWNVLGINELKLWKRKPIRRVLVTEQDFMRLKDRIFAPDEEVATSAGPDLNHLAIQQDTYDLEDDEEEADAVRIVNRILRQAIADQASDIHIEPMADRLRVRARIDGVLHEVMSLPIQVHPAVLARLKVMASMDIAERRVPQDGRMRVSDEKHGTEVDLRVSTLPTRHGEKLQIRIFDKRQAVTRIEQLGFSPEDELRFRRMIERPHGLILATGPTGCGKTSTLRAALQALNSPEKNITTIEDPIEYELPGIIQTQVHARAGYTFASGLRALYR